MNYGTSYGYTYEGIRVRAPNISGTKIINNTMVNTDSPTRQGSMVVDSTEGPSANLTISGNVLDKCGGDGIYLNNIHDSLVTDNIINVPYGRSFIKKLSSTNITESDNIETQF